MRTAIVYASVHHGNTKKIVKAIEEVFEVDLIDATKAQERDLSEYDVIGLASGIYMGKYHQRLLNFITINLPQEKRVFFIATYGIKRNYDKSILAAMEGRNARVIGRFGCPGYDTYGLFKLFCGIRKGHPDAEDIAAALEFCRKLKLTEKRSVDE